MSWSHRCRASAKCASTSNRKRPGGNRAGRCRNYCGSYFDSDFGWSDELELELLLGALGLGLALDPEAALPDVLELAPPLA